MEPSLEGNYGDRLAEAMNLKGGNIEVAHVLLKKLTLPLLQIDKQVRAAMLSSATNEVHGKQSAELLKDVN